MVEAQKARHTLGPVSPYTGIASFFGEWRGCDVCGSAPSDHERNDDSLSVAFGRSGRLFLFFFFSFFFPRYEPGARGGLC